MTTIRHVAAWTLAVLVSLALGAQGTVATGMNLAQPAAGIQVQAMHDGANCAVAGKVASAACKAQCQMTAVSAEWLPVQHPDRLAEWTPLPAKCLVGGAPGLDPAPPRAG